MEKGEILLMMANGISTSQHLVCTCLLMKEGNTALHLCMEKQVVNVDLVNLLLHHGADANSVSADGYTPLLLFASKCNRQSNPEVVTALMVGGADCCRVTPDGGDTGESHTSILGYCPYSTVNYVYILSPLITFSFTFGGASRQSPYSRKDLVLVWPSSTRFEEPERLQAFRGYGEAHLS